MDRPLRLGEAAALAGVSERTIRRWAERGALKLVRVGAETRYLREDVLRCARDPAKPRGWALSDHSDVDLDHSRVQRSPGLDSLGRSQVTSHDQCAVHRIAKLVAYGTARAASITATWDRDIQRKSNAAVARALSDQVAGGWSFSEVRHLVDGVMARWEPGGEDDDVDDDDDYEWSNHAWGFDDNDPD